jgi:putative ATP-dependent endonuclease of OLD family
MPDCAPEIVGKVKPGEAWQDKNDRRWRTKRDFQAGELEQHRLHIQGKASGQNVETFVADEWTLEYDLAYFGLARDVWIAAHLAKNDEAITAGSMPRETVARDALRSFSELSVRTPLR